MKTTNFDSFSIKNVETIPISYEQNEKKADFLLNDFKNIQIESGQEESSLSQSSSVQSTTSNKLLKTQYLQRRIKENQDFGKKLFLDLHLSNNFYTKTQKWLGHVIEKDEAGFKAVLKDLTDGGTDEYSEFSYEEVTPEDIPLISLGSAFYMSLGFVLNNGTRKKELEIRFQRLADFSENEVNNAGLDLSSEFINYFK